MLSLGLLKEMADLLFFAVLALFAITLIVIMFEKVNETAATLFSMSIAGALLVLGGAQVEGQAVSFGLFISLLEWDTILFITSMMIVVSIAASSGMFQYIALLLAVRTGGEPRRIFTSFLGFVFILSFFLDPLPTMMVMGPFTAEVCKALDMDVRALLVSEVIVANFASFPSVVGSVPNLLIVFWAGISPGEMFVMLLPLSVILLFVTFPSLDRMFGADLVDMENYDPGPLLMIKPSAMIRSRPDFYISAVGMALLILGFVIAPHEVTFISLAVASAMLAFSHERAKGLLRSLSWETIFFLIGLFGLVKALQIAGVIDAASQAMTAAIGTNPFIGILLMIWIPGFALSIIDNIPVAAFLAPMALDLGTVSRVVPVSLIIGANVGGYMIPFGDAPNMIVVSLCRENWKPLSFKEFTIITLQLGVIHLVISTIYCFILALFI
ncbi:MAG: hypothetical protein EAX95_06885 [Candidatus Thorarchaeota archaeon]|nr:hypothetical protein [Candidatus Thorarchaeota archaeon]